MTRSVVVRMRRRAPAETGRAVAAAHRRAERTQLADRLADWADVSPAHRRRLADMPDGIEDRDADVWEALLAVADLAGGDWPNGRVLRL